MKASERNSGRCVALTGAGSGIGLGVARALIARGYQVFGGAINDAETSKLAKELGERFMPFVIDVRGEESVVKAVGEVKRSMGRRPLVALLNIAGVIVNGPLADLIADEFQNVLSVNLLGMHNVTRAFLPQLSLHAGSKVLNMSSASGSRTMPFAGAYSASKFGVEALSSAMRMEFALLKIKVGVIAPGLINTPMAQKIQADLKREPSLPVYREPLRRFLEKTAQSAQDDIPLETVVNVICNAVEADRMLERYEIHNSFIRDVVIMRAMPTRVRELIVRKTLGL